MTADLTFDFGSFADTTVTVEAISPEGIRFLEERFGKGACSLTIKKSYAGDLGASAEAHGLRVA